MCVQPFVITDKYGRRQSVPCGRCYECRRAKQQEWCFRLDQEKRYSNISLFVTLTYDDEHILFADDEQCLNKRDAQLYFKRVRKEIEKKSLKYYCVGEYGDHTQRPHMHMLLFYSGNLPRSDFVRILENSWPCGFSYILPMQGATGYVTKYVMKMDSRPHLVPPFSLISQGIGIGYLTSEKLNYHKMNLISYGVKPGGYKVSLPRYYKDKIFTEYEKLCIKKQTDDFRKLKQFKVLQLIDKLGTSYFRNIDESFAQRVYSAKQKYLQSKKL